MSDNDNLHPMEEILARYRLGKPSPNLRARVAAVPEDDRGQQVLKKIFVAMAAMLLIAMAVSTLRTSATPAYIARVMGLPPHPLSISPGAPWLPEYTGDEQ